MSEFNSERDARIDRLSQQILRSEFGPNNESLARSLEQVPSAGGA